MYTPRNLQVVFVKAVEKAFGAPALTLKAKSDSFSALSTLVYAAQFIRKKKADLFTLDSTKNKRFIKDDFRSFKVKSLTNYYGIKEKVKKIIRR